MQLVTLVKCVLGAFALLWAGKPIHEAEHRLAHEHRFPGMPYNPWTEELARETLVHTLPAQALVATHFLSKRLLAPSVDEIAGYTQDAFLTHLQNSWNNAKYVAEAPAAQEEAPAAAEEEKPKDLKELQALAGLKLRKAGEKLWKLCGGIQEGQAHPLAVPVAKCLMKGALALYAMQPLVAADKANKHEHKYPGMPFNPWTPELARKTLLRALPEAALLTGEQLLNKHYLPTRHAQLVMPGAEAVAQPVAQAPAVDELKGYAEDDVAVAEAVAVAEGVTQKVCYSKYDYLVWCITGIALGAAGGWLVAKSRASRRAIRASPEQDGQRVVGVVMNEAKGSGSAQYHNIAGQIQHYQVDDHDENESSGSDEPVNCWPQLRRTKFGALP